MKARTIAKRQSAKSYRRYAVKRLWFGDFGKILYRFKRNQKNLVESLEELTSAIKLAVFSVDDVVRATHANIEKLKN